MARPAKNLTLSDKDHAMWLRRLNHSEEWVKKMRLESRPFREAFAARFPSPAPDEAEEEWVTVNRVHRVCIQWVGSMYARDPKISMRVPGWTMQDMRRKLEIDAAIMNTEIRRTDMGTPTKGAIQTAFLDGWSFLKTGFHAQWEYEAEEVKEATTNAIDENNGFELDPEFHPKGVLANEDHAEHIERHNALLGMTTQKLKLLIEKTQQTQQGMQQGMEGEVPEIMPEILGEIERMTTMLEAIDAHIRLHVEVEAKRDREGDFPTNARILSESCWVDQVHNSNVVWDMHATGTHDWRWVAERIIRPLEEFKKHERFKNTEDMKANFTRPIPGSQPDSEQRGGGGVKSAVLEPYMSEDGDIDALAAVWKIWDIEHQRVIYVQDGMKKPLLVEKWPHKHLKTAPLRMLYFELEEDTFRPIPPVLYMWPQQQEINRYRTKAAIITRRLARSAVADPRMDDTDLADLMNAKDGTVVKLTNIAVKPSEAIHVLDWHNVPVDVHNMAAIAQSDIEQDTGLGEVALGGDVGSDTATGVQAQQKSVGVTLDLKRDSITGFLKRVIGDLRGLMRQYYHATRFVEVFYDGSKEIESWTGEDLADFDMEVELADVKQQEKAVERMQWMDLVKTFGPVSQVIGLDMRKVCEQILRLMDVGNSTEFFVDQATQPTQAGEGVGPGQGQGQQQLPGNMPGTASGAVGQPAMDITK